MHMNKECFAVSGIEQHSTPSLCVESVSLDELDENKKKKKIIFYKSLQKQLSEDDDINSFDTSNAVLDNSDNSVY